MIGIPASDNYLLPPPDFDRILPGRHNSFFLGQGVENSSSSASDFPPFRNEHALFPFLIRRYGLFFPPPFLNQKDRCSFVGFTVARTALFFSFLFFFFMSVAGSLFFSSFFPPPHSGEVVSSVAPSVQDLRHV